MQRPADRCDSPEDLEHLGGTLAPRELAAFVAAWRRDRAALRAAEEALRTCTPKGEHSTQQGPSGAPLWVSCADCRYRRETDGRCTRREAWIGLFADAGGHVQGMNCALFDPRCPAGEPLTEVPS